MSPQDEVELKSLLSMMPKLHEQLERSAKLEKQMLGLAEQVREVWSLVRDVRLRLAQVDRFHRYMQAGALVTQERVDEKAMAMVAAPDTLEEIDADAAAVARLVAELEARLS